MLSTQHFGGRRKRLLAQATAYFIDEIHCQWRRGYVAVGIALNVLAAFSSVVEEVLVKDMRERQTLEVAC